MSNLSDFVAAADALALKVIFVVFDGLGGDPGPDAPALVTSGGRNLS